jgi:predicted nucleic acid-binding protein
MFNRNIDITTCEFNTFRDPSDGFLLETAYKAITKANAWAFIATNQKSFIWCLDPMIQEITKQMEILGYTNHSSATFEWVMCQMQFLVRNGKNPFMERFQ